MKYFPILFSILIISVDYCVTKCPNGINGYGLSSKARIDILFWHNFYRKELMEGVIPNLPTAAKMPEMFYDDELEVEAQYFANHCHYEHENITTKKWGQVGLNLYIQVSRKFDRIQEWAQVISDWWHQQDMYYFGRDIVLQNRHFVQMIWAKTEYIGCGFTMFPINHTDFILFHKFYVCAYAPKGNIPKEKPYEVVPFKKQSDTSTKLKQDNSTQLTKDNSTKLEHDDSSKLKHDNSTKLNEDNQSMLNKDNSSVLVGQNDTIKLKQDNSSQVQVKLNSSNV